jgi:uncharacterized protein YndB with AHSA1/START domain
METMTESVAIERELSIAARPETVWEFLVDPEKAVRWMGQAASLDPRPGGHYRVDVSPRSVALGEFVEVDPPRRLVWTWGWEPGGLGDLAPGSTTIEVDLIPDGDGTKLRFTHRGLPSDEAVQRHVHGWEHYLDRFQIAAAGGDAGVDPWLTGGMGASA